MQEARQLKPTNQQLTISAPAQPRVTSARGRTLPGPHYVLRELTRRRVWQTRSAEGRSARS